MTPEQRKQLEELYKRWLWSESEENVSVWDVVQQAYELGRATAMRPVQSIIDHSECFSGMLINE